MPLVDIDWLRDHVAVPEKLTYEQLAADLVKVGLEEEAIHQSAVTGPVVVGLVLSAEPEPQKNGKLIHWCSIDVGEHNDVDAQGQLQPRGIVCGAPNIAVGQKVVVALPGAVLPGDFHIEPRKTYGHISEGMCCSQRELGMSNEQSHGIIVLSEYGFEPDEYEHLQPGQDAIHLLHLDEPVLEINITPDRGYAFSYRGIAREFHHATGAQFTDPVVALLKDAPIVDPAAQGAHGDVEVRIDDAHPIHDELGCDRFYARLVNGVTVPFATPHWLRRRLTRAGMPVGSGIDDVSTDVMLDLGQPLAMYDADAVAQPIIVRRAADGEAFTGIDGVERKLNQEDLVIADSPDGVQGSRVLALAGVLAGAVARVTEQTHTVLVTAAHYDAVSIARTSRRHRIPSEAARRFERGVDAQLPPAAVQMAAQLLQRYAHGEPSLTPTDINHTSHRTPIVFKASEVERLTALRLSINTISDILTDIGCVVAGGGNGEFSVTPPSWRPDLHDPCDLVEEIARLVGYDQIPTVVPRAPVQRINGLTPEQEQRRNIAYELAEYGMVESLSYPFVGEQDYRAFGLDAAAIEPISVQIVNPLAGDRPFLRRELIMTLAQTVQRNLRRGLDSVALYELGHVYEQDPQAPAIPALPGRVKPTEEQLRALDAGLPSQPLHVAGMFTGLASDAGWLGERREADWTDAVEAMQRIMQRVGAHARLVQPEEAAALGMPWHPGRSAQVYLDDTVVGVVGELHPQVNETLGFSKHAAAFELDLSAMLAKLSSKPIKAKPISTFPPVKQDLAFTLARDVPQAAMAQALREAAGDVLESLTLFDEYEGEAVGEGMRSLAYALTLRAPDRTLDSEQIDAIRQRMVDAAAALGAQLRA